MELGSSDSELALLFLQLMVLMWLSVVSPENLFLELSCSLRQPPAKFSSARDRGWGPDGAFCAPTGFWLFLSPFPARFLTFCIVQMPQTCLSPALTWGTPVTTCPSIVTLALPAIVLRLVLQVRRDSKEGTQLAKGHRLVRGRAGTQTWVS